jgi:myo-inositol-1(or 4)-monophosphatase
MSAGPVTAGEAASTRAAVVEAGRIAMRFFRQKHERWEKGPGQIVTEADLAIDRFLHARLRHDHATDGWLSEETEDDRLRLERRRVWVVDPIDGTRSFAEGTPEFTICVGLLLDGVPVLGFVFNPATEEMFEARRGEGAFLNGKRLHASAAAGLEGARIVASKFESRRRNFASLIPRTQLTGIGSLAYKLALVACGRFDGYLSWRRTHDWDIAAAVLLLEEAGAVITDADGGPIRLNQPEPRHPGLVAAGPALHGPLLAATRQGYTAYAADRRARGLPA